MVDTFADLIGDHSSLHVNEQFARRSLYRKRVVHGMLPVMYLSCIDYTHLGYNNYVPGQLNVRFMKPLFPEDTVTLTVREQNRNSSPHTGDDEKSVFDFSLTQNATEELLTSGSIELRKAENESITGGVENAGDNKAESIIPADLDEQVLSFDEITKGMSATFPVSIGDRHTESLLSVLKNGLEDPESIQYSHSLVSVLLYASSVSAYTGMQIPGRYATFTELNSTWSLENLKDSIGEFHGEVSFLSESTGTVVSGFQLEGIQNKQIFGTGKIKTRVNQPPVSMPTMDEVRQQIDYGLADKVVLVTGASRGIGETVAKLFSAYGSSVAVNYYKGREDAERVVDEIRQAGGEAICLQADVTSGSQVDSMVTDIGEQFGSVDILVNNAVGEYVSRPFEHVTWDIMQQYIDIILKGAYNCCHAVMPGMVDSGFGRIINMSTAAAENPPAEQTGYVAAKSALIGLTRSLAVEYAPKNITVNAVMPGFTETDLTAGLANFTKESLRQGMPMKRFASPLDIAQAVVYLASERSGYITGQQIPVTGGQPPFF